MLFVKGIHNHISDALSRSPVGGSEGIKRVLRRLRGVFRNTWNESGYSPNQLFFLRNWRDHNLPDVLAEPVMEEMEEARERVKAGNSKIMRDENIIGLPKLHVGDMVRGQDSKTKEWSLKGFGVGPWTEITQRGT